jgi:enoyl-CoA hydratase/carnithine racemase
VNTVQLENADGVATMTLSSPPVNALGRQLVEDLETALEELKHDAAVNCLVVRSAGKHFCAGADLKERREMDEHEILAFVPRLAGVCHGMADLPFPTIAAVRGAAAGGGCELALACDLRVLADDTKIGLRETALAIIPGAGGTQRLPRLVGPAKAKRWIFGAEMHDAAAALADGVADRVVPVAELDSSAHTLARTIAANGPVALRLAKKAIEGGAALAMPEALKHEWECYLGVLRTSDRVEALKAFAEKRAPKFEGR